MRFLSIALTLTLSSSLAFGEVEPPKATQQGGAAGVDLNGGQQGLTPDQSGSQGVQGVQGVQGITGAQQPPEPLNMSAGGDLVKCPIIPQEEQLRRSLAPSSADIRRELAAAVQAARGSRNEACRTLGTSFQNLLSAFGGAGGGMQSTCESDPARCAGMLDTILPQISQCTENRESFTDMATSIALNLTAGTPLGIVSLGVSAFRSFVSLFSGRAERRREQAEQRRIAEQRRDVIEAAASCAMMTFYQISICAPVAQANIRGLLDDSANPAPRCTNRANLGAMTHKQIFTSIGSLNKCLGDSASRVNQCTAEIGSSFTPAVTSSASGPERAACLVEEVAQLTANSTGFRDNDIPLFLRMARRHHTNKIINLRNRLAASQPTDASGIADRNSLLLHCYYGKMARTISASNPERSVAQAELQEQDNADVGRGGVLRDVPEANRVLLAQNAGSIDSICGNIDNCISNTRADTIEETFGPSTAETPMSQRMCGGIQKFIDYDTNTLDGRLGSMERAVMRGGSYGQNCVASATPGPSSEATTVDGQ